jgi:hypothetical protein
MYRLSSITCCAPCKRYSNSSIPRATTPLKHCSCATFVPHAWPNKRQIKHTKSARITTEQTLKYTRHTMISAHICICLPREDILCLPSLRRTIKAMVIRTPPRVYQLYLSYEGTGGRFSGPDIQLIDCSYFHFRCTGLSCHLGSIGQELSNRLAHGANGLQRRILLAGIASDQIGILVCDG